MQETDQDVNAQFDNKFYQRLTEGYGVLTSDVVLFRDPRTQGLVQQFADVSWILIFADSRLCLLMSTVLSFVCAVSHRILSKRGSTKVSL
jgi:hypothetical protein